ncbi:MAG: restriction endonuclease subunit S [Spirochaetota bacterium]
MKNKPYPKNKPSGVEWLGEVPEHWNLIRLKSIGRFKAGAGFPDEEQGLEEEELPFFKVADMNNADNSVLMKTANNYVSKATARKLGAYIFKSKTVIFAKVGAALLLNRRRILDHDSCIDNNTMGYEIRSADYKYVYYWLTPIDFGRLANPGAVPSINDGQLREISIALPPLPEQQAIAVFLDRETSRIDSLIDKKKKLLELLAEQRTALISRAVTKGLDAGVKLKPSGVEWLGEVPEHWEVSKLKYGSQTSTGLAFSSDDYTDEGIPLIRIGDILQDGTIDIQDSKRLPEEYLRTYHEATIRKGDILMAMTGATIGKAGRYQFEEPGLLNQRVCKFVPHLIIDNYFWFILKSEQYLEHIVLTGFGGAQPNISDVQLLDFYAAIPPLSEQHSIAAFLNTETARIDALVAKIKSAIGKLQEYRTALISAAVTGKIDLRE